MIEEHNLGEEPEDETPEWQLHDWTAEEVQFVAAYLRTGNAARAYRETFNARGDMAASIKGGKILRRPHVGGYVDHVQRAMIARLAVTKENVLEELAKLGYANMSDFVVLQSDGTPQFDVSGLTRAQFAAIQEMSIDTYVDGKGEDAREVRSVKVKLAPKLGALEAMGKHLKLFTDVIETHDTTDVADELRRARQERQARKQENDDGSDGQDTRGSGEDDGDTD